MRRLARAALAIPCAPLLALTLACADSGPLPPSSPLERQRGTFLAGAVSPTRPNATPRIVPVAPRADASRTSFRTPFGDTIAPPAARHDETSVGGRALHYWVFGDGPETVLILGGIHGDEPSSSRLAYDFVDFLADHAAALGKRRVVVAPEVNPDGIAANSRRNQRGVDLNRNFPAGNWRAADAKNGAPGPEPSSEPETRFVLSLLRRFAPARIVSAHAAAACVNFDGPAEALAHFMSRECGLPSRATIGYPTPGSLGSLMGVEQAVPTITLELASRSSIGAARAGCLRALMTAVYFPVPVPPDVVASAR